MTTQDHDSRSGLWRFAGLVLLVLGVLGLVNAVPQAELLWNSLVVVTGSLAIGAILGGFAGWLIGWTDVSGRRWWLALLLAWAMTPLVVQLAAWDSLWGRLSWFAALNEVTYSRWFEGLAAVLWVQAFASVPWIALLVIAARPTVSTSSEEEAQQQWSLVGVFFRVTLPRHAALFLLILLVVGLRTFEQIEVSDVYQIRTWPEVWYLGFALGTFEGWGSGTGTTSFLQFLFGSELSTQAWGTTQETPANATAIYPVWQVIPSLLAFCSGFGLLTVHGLTQWFRVLPSWDWQPERRLATMNHWRWNLFLFGTVAVPPLVILSNLLIRCGLRVNFSNVNNAAERRWSWETLGQRLGTALTDYHEPMIWSWLIGLVSGILVCLISVCLAWWAYRRIGATIVVLVLAATSLIVPAPLVSLLWYRCLNLSPWEWLDVLAQTSILGPVLAIGLKTLGLALLYCLVIFRQQPAAWREDMEMCGQGGWSQFWHLGVRIPWLWHVSLLLILTMIGAGDLSASFATLPPGLDTLPRRLLGDLHSGASGNVAAACLLQMGAVALVSVLITRWYKTTA
ncbi:MAG: hypothetical protein Q8M16_08500 [Pirellulaceae bacterium]|nr:hypothetical protein [Pirellulaceae bacterium]